MDTRPLALIFEDDDASAESLAFLLRDWGAEVVRGVDGDTMRQSLGARTADARFIIADYDLGGGDDGVSLAQSFIAAAPGARVLVLTGFHRHAAKAAEAAGFDLMRKPARADAILAWLDRA